MRSPIHGMTHAHDLLVTDGVAIARLRHGTLRGRTNRFGFKTECETVRSASHWYFRHQLESYNCRVHLCAGTPCRQPDLDCLHVTSSALIPHEADLDLQDAVGRGPVARCDAIRAAACFPSAGGAAGLRSSFSRLLCILQRRRPFRLTLTSWSHPSMAHVRFRACPSYRRPCDDCRLGNSTARHDVSSRPGS